MINMPVVLLMVPDTEYHSRVLILFGINILNVIKRNVLAKEFILQNTFAKLARHEAVVENTRCL